MLITRLKKLIAILQEAKAIIKKRREEQAERDERERVAQVFNDRYTYRREWILGMDRLPGSGCFGITARGGFAWMCPDCRYTWRQNKVCSMEYTILRAADNRQGTVAAIT